jgi:hypothetical protein
MDCESEKLKHVTCLVDEGEAHAYTSMAVLEKAINCLEAGKMPPNLFLRKLKKSVSELRKKHDAITRDSIKLVTESKLSPADAEKKLLQRRQRAISSAFGYTRERGRTDDWMRNLQIAQQVSSIIIKMGISVDEAIGLYQKQPIKVNLSEKRIRDIYYDYLELLR